ncbi:response regulator, partial [Stenotrophomonas maltophilia]
MQPQALKHLEGPATRVRVVDVSKLVRKQIAEVLQR